MAAALLYCNAMQNLLNGININSQLFLLPLSGEGQTAGKAFRSTETEKKTRNLVGRYLNLL